MSFYIDISLSSLVLLTFLYNIYIYTYILIIGAQKFHNLCDKYNKFVPPKLNWEFFQKELSDHPDQAYANGIINIARFGFKYGMIEDVDLLAKLPKHVSNLSSAYEHMEALMIYYVKNWKLAGSFVLTLFLLIIK